LLKNKDEIKQVAVYVSESDDEQKVSQKKWEKEIN
jgi:hypothetical protein